MAVTTTELADYLGVPESELPTGAAYVLGLASQIADAAAAPTTPQAAVDAVVLAMTSRALANPAGHVTEEVGGYVVRYNPNALLLTEDELGGITPPGTVQTGQWSGSITTPRPYPVGWPPYEVANWNPPWL